MSDFFETARVPIQLTHDSLIASIQIELNQEVLDQFQKDLLLQIETTHAHAVIFDLSGIDIIDSREFESISRTMKMAQLMGAITVLTGLQPGVASSLTELEVDTKDLLAARTLEDAFVTIEDVLSESRKNG